ncbi:SCP1.201-like deaminase [Saccharothrix sp. BKS2]|uniref:DddA-like double-stranded DNA deaminase toxin n=1 Tax=Saccharothrix sp. BKS2 TaxID=3064400 RepID=UPI0039E79B02
MASLDEVIEAVDNALAKAEESGEALDAALDLVEDAHILLGTAVEGGTTSDGDTVQAAFTTVIKGIKDLTEVLAQAVHSAETLQTGLRGDPSPTPADRSSPPPPTALPTPTADDPSALSPEEIERLRRDLPPPVVSGTGQKTHGRWVAPDGTVRPIVSGDGPEADSAAGYLRALPLPRRGLPFATWHAETKLAAHMRDTGIRHVSVVVNNPPCPGTFGCETLVGLILPEGSSLTIHGPDGYNKTIPGGRRPPWQR